MSGDDYQIWVPPNALMRERATVPAAKELPPLVFIIPRYVDYAEDGTPHYAITNKRDWERVKDGYACAKCLLIFQRYREDCPICDWVRDPARDISDQIHDYWQPQQGRTSEEVLRSTGTVA